MNIFIMTKGREGNIETLKHIPAGYLGQTYIVCPSTEIHPHQTIKVDLEHENHSTKFVHILENLIGQDKGVIIDDDVTFSRRVGDGPSFIKAKTWELVPMWGELESHLDFVPMAGVHPRQMANMSPLPFKEIGKIICVYGINGALLPRPLPNLCVHAILAEQILNYHCLSHGLKNRLVTRFAQDHGPSQAPGGCDYRTAEMQELAAKYVAEQYGPYVKAVLKRPKTATWLGAEFWDVRVQWKQMYNSGVASK